MNNNVQPLISVVVLTYNQEKTIARTLDSIIQQKTQYSFEIIIGEDASPSDKTREVCEQYVSRYPHMIKLLPKVPNKGLLRNYLDCLKECRGKYIACCAGDDWWHNESKLQMQADYMDSHRDCVLCYTNYDRFQVAKNKIVKNALPANSLNTDNMIEKLLCGFFLPPLTTMFRREMLQYIDFDDFIERGYMTEDLPMYLEFALHSNFHCINVSTATYSAEAGSISHFSNAEKMERFMLNIRDIKLDFLAKHPLYSSQKLKRLYNKLILRSAIFLKDIPMIIKYLFR